jgi:CRP-like cAMP-binding protein
MHHSATEVFISKYSNRLSEVPRDLIMQALQITELRKKHVLIKTGERHPYAYFMVRGAARSYYLKDGIEVNTWFALEHDIIGSLLNFRNLPARETVELMEDSTVLAIDMVLIRKHMQSNQEITNFILAIVEEYALFLEEKAFYLQMTDSMEKYRILLETAPELLQRVPLTYLSSFLGMSRETLSRIRAK